MEKKNIYIFMRAEVMNSRGKSWWNLLETGVRLFRDGEKTDRTLCFGSRRWTVPSCSGTHLQQQTRC